MQFKFRCTHVWGCVVWNLGRTRPKSYNQRWSTHIALQVFLLEFLLVRAGLGNMGRQTSSVSRLHQGLMAVLNWPVMADRCQEVAAAWRPSLGLGRDVVGARWWKASRVSARPAHSHSHASLSSLSLAKPRRTRSPLPSPWSSAELAPHRHRTIAPSS